MATTTHIIPPVGLPTTSPVKSFGGKKAPAGLITITDEDDILSTSPRSHLGKKSLPGFMTLNDDDLPIQAPKSYVNGKKAPTSSSILTINDDDVHLSGHKLTGGKKAPSGFNLSILNEDDTSKPYVNNHSVNGAKRVAPGPLVTTSDEEESDSLPPTPRSSVTRSPSVTSPTCTEEQQHAHEAYEHDHDYENVASPGGSSTSSGPVYVRQPGFKQHAHEVKKLKKKKTLIDVEDGLRRRAPTPPKLKPRREPVPMRRRALPQSFWKQPNVPNQVSPANLFPSLPPLCSREAELDITDLLLKHLFAGVVDDKKNPPALKRGRPRKLNLPTKPTNTKALISGEDPYIVDAVTEKFFPTLSLESRQGNGSIGNSSLQLITLKEGDKSVTLPSLSIEQNYSQIIPFFHTIRANQVRLKINNLIEDLVNERNNQIQPFNLEQVLAVIKQYRGLLIQV
ncbi:hypothetical protein KUTeg_002217 [Tegillarca granosa]|uniref:Uncharacterized protein n=1 Tax=Tegillarca granosa TaxID=220873 RepID=A0ABQ9FTT5_TEGGR|nr:hypothetical protein KUTeg_002217 [Tegillarca granosa]